jgi:RNA polymerase sigma-70 factor (ECF subfamily)
MEKSDIQFDEVFTSFHPKVLAYLRRLLGEQDAEDAAQEVFLKISKCLHRFRGQSQLSTWVYRIATNTALDRLRIQTRRRRLTGGSACTDPMENLQSEGIAEDLWKTEAPATPEQMAVRKEMNTCIRGVVEGLPPAYRTVLVLSDIEGLTDKEIAEVLGVTVESVKIRLHRARGRLKRELEVHCTFYRDERNELACDRKSPSLDFSRNG